MKRKNLFLVIGAIILIVTLAIALIYIKDWSGLTPFSLGLILWAEFALFVGLFVMELLSEKGEKVILNSAFSVILVCYALLTILVSALYMPRPKTASASFAVLNLVLLAAAVITLLVFYAISKNVKSKNDGILNAGETIRGFSERLGKLAVSGIGASYATSITKLADSFRYTDTSSLVEEDSKIEQRISELEIELMKAPDEIDSARVEAMIVSLNSLLSQRNISIKATKKGRF